MRIAPPAASRASAGASVSTATVATTRSVTISHRLVAEGVAIDLLVGVVEVLDDRRRARLVERPVRHLGAQLEALPDIAAFGDLPEAALAGRNAVGIELPVGPRHQVVEHAR